MMKTSSNIKFGSFGNDVFYMVQRSDPRLILNFIIAQGKNIIFDEPRSMNTDAIVLVYC